MSDKVKIIWTEIMVHEVEFTFEEFKKKMQKEDEAKELTEAMIMKMWRKLLRKQVHKIKEKRTEKTYPDMSDGFSYVFDIVKWLPIYLRNVL
jgi:3-phenylpropionate/cinnamic acid dioxygenase small subunit